MRPPLLGPSSLDIKLLGQRKPVATPAAGAAGARAAERIGGNRKGRQDFISPECSRRRARSTGVAADAAVAMADW